MLKNKFNISIAEVDKLDNRQIAELGVAFVSNEHRFIQSVLSKVLDFVRGNPCADLTDSEIEIL